MLAQLQPETEQAVHEDAVVGDEVDEFAVKIEVRVNRALLQGNAVLQAVLDRGRGDYAKARIAADVESRAAGDAAGEIGPLLADALQQHQVGVAQLLQDAGLVHARIGNARAAVEEGLQGGRRVARAVIEAGPVGVGPVIGQPVGKGGLRIAADAGGQRQEALVGNGAGGEVDHTAAEFAREVGRISLLNQAGGDDVGREDIERDHAAERLRARQRQAVEQGERIAIAEAAHEHVAVALHRQTGHAAQRAGDVPFPGTGDVFGRQHVDHLGRAALHVLDRIAGDHDDAAAGDRDILVLQRFVLRRDRILRIILPDLGRFRGVGGRQGRRGACILGGGKRRHGHGGPDQQQGGQAARENAGTCHFNHAPGWGALAP